jgi:hypothetical protein
MIYIATCMKSLTPIQPVLAIESNNMSLLNIAFVFKRLKRIYSHAG